VHASTHRWWDCDLSLADEALFTVAKIRGAGSVTDAYLLGLAKQRRGRVASFDRALPWEAVLGGSSDLVELLGG
jgi:predicted nucleic acid-binding protein